MGNALSTQSFLSAITRLLCTVILVPCDGWVFTFGRQRMKTIDGLDDDDAWLISESSSQPFAGILLTGRYHVVVISWCWLRQEIPGTTIHVLPMGKASSLHVGTGT